MSEPAALVARIGQRLRARGERLATAESCTGGLIAAACTSVAGSSDWFDCGVVSYSNDAKAQWLGVDAALIAREGAVSEGVARAMAHGLLGRSQAQWTLAATGVAGPGGGTPAKPVGLVWLARAHAGDVHALRLELSGDRGAVRAQAVQRALQWLHEALDVPEPR